MAATRGLGTPRQCPIGGPGLDQCPRTVRAGHLMCGYHWREVPKDLQNDVWRTWRRWNKTMEDDDWAAYAVAREAALDTFTPSEETPHADRPW